MTNSAQPAKRQSGIQSNSATPLRSAAPRRACAAPVALLLPPDPRDGELPSLDALLAEAAVAEGGAPLTGD